MSKSRPNPAFMVGIVVVGILAGVLALAGVFGDGDERSSTPRPAATSSPPNEPDDRTRVLPGVVGVRVDSRSGDRRRSGLGFVIDDDGHIVTSHQVAGRARRLVVHFADKPIDAEVLGTDPSVDVALLRVDPADIDGRPQVFELGSSAGVRRGDPVVAVGSPPSAEDARSSGTVSAIARMTAPDGFLIAGGIVTDAPIDPSDAGSPLLDDEGQVVGVNSQILARGSGDGLAVAVPVDEVKRAVEALRRGETVERAYLGARLDDAPTGGVAVVGVLAGGPAARAGLRQGDLLIEFDRTRLREPDDVAAAVNARRPGEDVDLTVERAGMRRTLTVELGTQPARP